MITQAVKLSVKQSSGEKHKRTQQGASTKLEFYLYCYMLVHATISLSRPQEVDLVSFHFFIFLYLFFLSIFPFVLFLAPRVRVSDDIGHMAQRRF